MEGIPALQLWDQVIEVFEGKKRNKANSKPGATQARGVTPVHETLANVDFVPPSVPPLTGRGILVILEDNEAVIKMTVKGRSPNMRHVARTHRVDLDFLFDLFKKDHGITIRYVGTKSQIADILTKGQFTTVQWQVLSHLAQVCTPGKSLGETPCNKATEKQIVDTKKKKKAEGNIAKACHVSLVCPSVVSVVGQSPDSSINVVGHTLFRSNVTYVRPQPFSLQTSLLACTHSTSFLGSSPAMTTQSSSGGKAGKPGVTSGACLTGKAGKPGVTSGASLVSADIIREKVMRENTKKWLIGCAQGTKALAELGGDMSLQVHAANVKWEDMSLQGALRLFSKALNSLHVAGHLEWTRKAEFMNFAAGDHCIHLQALQTQYALLSELAAQNLQLMTIADSSYCMGKGTTKQTVLQEAMDELNKGRYSKITVEMKPGGNLPDLLASIKNWVKIHAGGDPSKFKHHMVVTTNLNDATASVQKVKELVDGDISAEDRQNAEEFRDYISELEHVIVIGPGNDELWHAPRFLAYATPMMNIIRECGHPCYDGVPLFQSLEKSNTWHFGGSWENVKKLAFGIHNAALVLNHLTNLKKVVDGLKRNKANLVPATVSSDARSFDQSRTEATKREVTFAIQNEDRKNAEAFNSIASRTRWNKKDSLEQAGGDPEQEERNRVAHVCEMAGLSEPIVQGDIFRSPPRPRGTNDIPPATEYNGPTLDQKVGVVGPMIEIGPILEVKYVELGPEKDPGVIFKCWQASLNTKKIVWIPAFRYYIEKGLRVDYARKVGHMPMSPELYDKETVNETKFLADFAVKVKEEQSVSAGGDSGDAPALTKIFYDIKTSQVVDDRGAPYKGQVSAEAAKKLEPFSCATIKVQKGSTPLASAGGDSLPKAGTGFPKFSEEMLKYFNKPGVHTGWSKAATFVLRHKEDYKGNKFIDEQTGWLKWGVFVRLFKDEASKRVRPFINLKDPNEIISTLQDASDWFRFEVQYVLSHAAGDRRPYAIRAAQGQSTKKEIPELVKERVPITEEHAAVLYHGTTNAAALKIKDTGLIPGGGKAHGRPELYLSLLHPDEPARASAPGDRVKYIPYKFQSEALVAVNVKKARAAGCIFSQSKGIAVLTSNDIPPSALMYAVNYRTKANIWSNYVPPADEEKEDDEEHQEQGAEDNAGGDPGVYDDTIPDFGVPKEEEIPQTKTLPPKNKIGPKTSAGGDSVRPLPPPTDFRPRSDVGNNPIIKKALPRCANIFRWKNPIGGNGRDCTNSASGTGLWPDYCNDACHDLHLKEMEKTLAEKYKEDPEGRCSNCHTYNSAGTFFCKFCKQQLENEGAKEETQQNILDKHDNQASGDLGLEIVIKRARGGQSRLGAFGKYCRKAVRRLPKVSVKYRAMGILKGPDYKTLPDRFERDPIWRAEMIGAGNDLEMIRQMQRTAEQPVDEIGLKREYREAAFGVRAQVTSTNKSGGSGTVSVKNVEGYKRYAEECRDNYPQGKRGKGPDTSSSAAGDRWPGDKKGGKGSKNWNSSASSSWESSSWSKYPRR
jgi:RNA:NAD 2'-phosphotransferase (TPT1/KptA family)